MTDNTNYTQELNTIAQNQHSSHPLYTYQNEGRHAHKMQWRARVSIANKKFPFGAWALNKNQARHQAAKKTLAVLKSQASAQKRPTERLAWKRTKPKELEAHVVVNKKFSTVARVTGYEGTVRVTGELKKILDSEGVLCLKLESVE